MTRWYYATDSTVPDAIRLVAFDAHGAFLGEYVSGVATHGLNQTRSNGIHALIVTYGDRFDRYEEWHAMNDGQTATLQLDAWHEDGRPSALQFTAVLPTMDDAHAFVAMFPKSARLRACFLNRPSSGNSGPRNTVGYVECHIGLAANGSRGARNETGVARYRSIVKRAAALGIGIEFRSAFANSYSTREEFEAAALPADA